MHRHGRSESVCWAQSTQAHPTATQRQRRSPGDGQSKPLSSNTLMSHCQSLAPTRASIAHPSKSNAVASLRNAERRVHTCGLNTCQTHIHSGTRKHRNQNTSPQVCCLSTSPSNLGLFGHTTTLSRPQTARKSSGDWCASRRVQVPGLTLKSLPSSEITTGIHNKPY